MRQVTDKVGKISARLTLAGNHELVLVPGQPRAKLRSKAPTLSDRRSSQMVDDLFSQLQKTPYCRCEQQ